MYGFWTAGEPVPANECSDMTGNVLASRKLDLGGSQAFGAQFL